MEVSALSVKVLGGVLEEHTGQQLLIARRWRIETALTPLMRTRNIATLDQLAGQVTLARDPRLVEDVVEALLNHETFFFRDMPAFDLLTKRALPKLADARRAERRLRIWCAGCSTGQEVYSLAMCFADQPKMWEGWSIDIIGTDVSPLAIQKARAGVYSQFEIQRGLPVRQMLSWFEAEGDQWRVRAELRPKIGFHVHNLMQPPPAMGRFDVILCRNVLLYFSDERRRKVLDRVASAIADDGVLMLGAGETVIGQTDRFVSHSECRGLYRPVERSRPELPALRNGA